MVCTQRRLWENKVIQTSCNFPYPICLEGLRGDFGVCEFFQFAFFRLRKDTADTIPVFPPSHSLVLICG